MPAQILHALFGEMAISDTFARFKAEAGLKKALEDYSAAFALGCQGPDIFYHSRMTRPLGLEYGSLLHRRGFEDFSAALLRKTFSHPLDARSLSPLSAYALGFITHDVLDRACHPYIIYKSQIYSETDELFAGMSSRGKAHSFFERILDALMLERLKGAPIESSYTHASLAEVCYDPPSGLKALLKETLEETFPERADKDKLLCERISNALKDCALFYSLSDPQNKRENNPLPVAYRYPEHIPAHTDYLNLKHESWHYPIDGALATDTRSFPELLPMNALNISEVLTRACP
jgi:hypothetical protein